MLPERVFKIEHGYCHILLDKIAITAREEPVSIDELKEDSTIPVRVIIYSLAIAFFVAAAIFSFVGKDWYRFLLCLVAVAWFSIRVIKRNQFSTDTFIPRAAIAKIEFKPAIYSIQKPHFLIHYKSGSLLKKKWVLLLSNDYLKEDDAQIRQAIDIMHEEFG